MDEMHTRARSVDHVLSKGIVSAKDTITHLKILLAIAGGSIQSMSGSNHNTLHIEVVHKGFESIPKYIVIHIFSVHRFDFVLITF